MAQYGIWGIGSAIGKPVMPAMGSFLRGFHFYFPWNRIEPSPNVFTFSEVDPQFKQAASLGLDIGFMVWTGDWAPDWLYQAPYSVPKLYIDSTGAGNQSGGISYFPYYYNDVYKQQFKEMLTRVINHLTALPEEVLSRIKFLQSCEGTTGDEGAYHGKVVKVTINGIPQPNPSSYEIPIDDAWDVWKKEIWAHINSLLKEKVPTCEMMVNPANNGFNFDYATDTYPTAFLKHGDYSHNFAFFSNIAYKEYVLSRASPTLLNRGELAMESVMAKWNSLNACPQGLWALITCALDAGMNTLNIPLGVWQYLKAPDTFSYDFFNEFALPTNNATAPIRKGFAVLRRQVDIANTDTYPEDIFGPLIDPSLKKGYDNAVRIINADPTSNYYEKQFKISSQRRARLNQQRPLNIVAAFAQYGFKYTGIQGRDDDNYSYDLGIDVTEGNFKRYINQINSNTTCKPVVRIGNPSVNQLGRYGLYTTTEMFFETTSEGLTTTGNNHVTFHVYYWNEGIGTVRIFYWNGRRRMQAGTIVTSDSKQYLLATFLVTDFKGGGNLANGADFTIKRVSGVNVTISLIKIYALSLPPVDTHDGEPPRPCRNRGININFNIAKLIIKLGRDDDEPEEPEDMEEV